MSYLQYILFFTKNKLARNSSSLLRPRLTVKTDLGLNNVVYTGHLNVLPEGHPNVLSK